MLARFRSNGWKTASAVGLTAVIAVSGTAAIAGPKDKIDAKTENWGLIDRNTIGSPVGALRDGPAANVIELGGQATAPPLGKGSLGIEVASSAEKVSFGDQVDFFGQNVLDLNAIGYQIFQTGEDVDNGGASNLANLTMEIDANLNSLSADNYTSMVWVPDGTGNVPNKWSDYIDATTNGYWYFTGAEGGATGCTVSTHCTFAQAKAALNDGGDPPLEYTFAVNDGRDHQFQGAVDAVRYNDRVYDFESDGVKQKDVK